MIQELGSRFGEAPALFSRREDFSHAALAAQANRYSRWALSQGIAKGDVVCLVMPNRADYLAIWLGLTRIGAVVALINTNLSGEALATASAWPRPGISLSMTGWRRIFTTTPWFGGMAKRLQNRFQLCRAARWQKANIATSR